MDPSYLRSMSDVFVMSSELEDRLNYSSKSNASNSQPSTQNHLVVLIVVFHVNLLFLY